MIRYNNAITKDDNIIPFKEETKYKFLDTYSLPVWYSP